MIGPLLALTVFAAPPSQEERAPWEMDYGPFLSTVVEVAPDNIAYKGVAIPVGRDDEGEVTESILFDTDLLRVAAGWQGGVDLRGIVYDGPHGIWPRIDGEPVWTTPAKPGWSLDGTFEDPRTEPYGPLPRASFQWDGLTRCGADVVLHYRVGWAEIREHPYLVRGERGLKSFVRALAIPPLERPLYLLVAEVEAGREGRVRQLPHGRVFLPEPSRGSASLHTVPGRARGLFAFVKGDVDGVDWYGPKTSRTLILAVAPSPVPRRVEVHLSELASISRNHDWIRSLPQSRGVDEVLAEAPTLWGEPTILAARPAVTDAKGVTFEERRVPGDGAAMETVFGAEGDVRWSLERDAHGSYSLGRPRLPESDGAWMGSEGWAPLVVCDFDEGRGSETENRVTGRSEARFEGAGWRRGLLGNALDFDGEARVLLPELDGLELTETDLTAATWIHTSKDGTIFSLTVPEGEWVPDGKALFVRGGRLCFDIGWVGVVTGRTRVDDARWHHVALVWRHAGSRVSLYVDGVLDAEGELEPEGPTSGHAFQLGFAAEDFPAEPWFSGYMDGLRVYGSALEAGDVLRLASATGEPIVSAAVFLLRAGSVKWTSAEDRVTLRLPPGSGGILVTWRGLESRLETIFSAAGLVNNESQPFTLERVSWPEDHPSRSWMRFGAFDFFADDARAAITTWSGDVWTVTGLRGAMHQLVWQRVATGLHQPLGLTIVDDEVYVLGRDQITHLVDRSGDGEADDYYAFFNGALNSEHFHEPATGLQADGKGGFTYLKAARHAKEAVHSQHGSLIHVAADGASHAVLARGFRAPNGLFDDGDGVFYGSDQEGHWMPANRINRITAGGFYGNNWALLAAPPREDYAPPLCWIHPKVDRSPSSQVRVPTGVWGDLAGSLLGLSYGTGEVYLLFEDEVDGTWQGGLTPLPIELPTGLMNGRFQKSSGDLFLCGLFGWSSDKTEPGGFYRVRRTDAPFPRLTGVEAVRDGLVLRFNVELDAAAVRDPDAFDVDAWNYRWSERYGSPDYRLDGGEGRTAMELAEARLAEDGRSVWLRIEAMQPAMQFHTRFRLKTADGEALESFAHHTVHVLAPESGAERLR